MKGHIVKEETDLFSYLLSLGYRRTRTKQLLKFKALAVNGTTVLRHDQSLKPGDSLTISGEKNVAAALPPGLGLQVLYEDEALIVVDKPAGLLTIGTEKERTKTAYFQLNEYLRAKDPQGRERVFIVHRLDRETSGVIIFAKSEAIKRRLQADWKDVRKSYRAVVEGIPAKAEDIIEGYLNETGTLLVYESKNPRDSKYAVTRYKVVRPGRDYSLLEVGIDTGRKHQIRVHLSGIGHPVAGDRKYGAETDPIKRLALHAFSLTLVHPLSKKSMVFTSSLPQSFGPLIKRMKAAT